MWLKLKTCSKLSLNHTYCRLPGIDVELCLSPPVCCLHPWTWHKYKTITTSGVSWEKLSAYRKPITALTVGGCEFIVCSGRMVFGLIICNCFENRDPVFCSRTYKRATLSTQPGLLHHSEKFTDVVKVTVKFAHRANWYKFKNIEILGWFTFLFSKRYNIKDHLNISGFVKTSISGQTALSSCFHPNPFKNIPRDTYSCIATPLRSFPFTAIIIEHRTGLHNVQ